LITILSLKDSSNKKSKRSDFLNEKNYKWVMYKNGKEQVIKKSLEGVNSSMIYLIHCNNLCKSVM
jgi:hypothetical protein